ncbi:WD40 repeat-like protein [Wallemia mellicola]|nr:WD40 repeat-like protein [Wallemia mellicola]TIC52728.1 WD40 repeat-like protein [Wallemia mellicola]
MSATDSRHERSLTQIIYNKDGDLIFSVSKDHRINVWYSHNGERYASIQHRLGTYEGHNGTVWSVSVDKNSEYLVSGSADNTLKLWSVKTGECLYTWEFPTAIKRVQWSNDDNRILAITEERMGYKGALRIIEINKQQPTQQSAEPKHFFEPAGSKITVAAFTAIGNEVVTGHENGKIAKYNYEEQKEVAASEGAHQDSIMDLQLSLDQTYFITSSKDKVSKLFDTNTLETIKTFSTDSPLNSASIAPGSPYIIVGGGQEAMNVTTTSARQGKFECRFWHKVFGEEVGRVKGHFGPINTIAVHPEGKAFASGGEDGYVRVHWFDESYFRTRVYGDLEPEMD